jgi:molecular chaperone HscB
MSAPDFFGLFGLPERFEIDAAELERRYLSLSRELHPDRHASGTPGERLAAVQRTTDLNAAYQVLRDEFKRTEHLLHRRGIETTEADSQDHRATVESSVLHEVLELREGLAEAKEANDQARIATLTAEVEARSARAWESIREGWRTVESGDASPLREIKKQLTSLRYYRRFLDEVAGLDEA